MFGLPGLTVDIRMCLQESSHRLTAGSILAGTFEQNLTGYFDPKVLGDPVRVCSGCELRYRRDFDFCYQRCVFEGSKSYSLKIIFIDFV